MVAGYALGTTANEKTAITVLAGTSALGAALIVAALIDDFEITAIGGIVGGLVMVFSLLGMGFVLARKTERHL